MYCAHCGTEVQTLAAPCPACGKPASGAPAAGGGSNAALIAVLVVGGGLVLVAIVGIIAAIAIPNFLNAVERGRQKRTMADMRTVATAVESFAVDAGYYPEAGSMDELAEILEPTYLRAVPRSDGWENELMYQCWRENPSFEGCDRFALVAAGRDGVFELLSPRDYGEDEVITTHFDEDIVWTEGSFVRYPQGSY